MLLLLLDKIVALIDILYNFLHPPSLLEDKKNFFIPDSFWKDKKRKEEK